MGTEYNSYSYLTWAASIGEQKWKCVAVRRIIFAGLKFGIGKISWKRRYPSEKKKERKTRRDVRLDQLAVRSWISCTSHFTFSQL